MMFLDSWIFIEFFSGGKWQRESEKLLERIRAGETAVISTIVLTEVKYRLAKLFGIEKADRVIYLIENFSSLSIVPLNAEVAKLAADLRLKYYDKGKRAISFADAINLATAIKTHCDVLYSGDPDFKDMDEIKTVIV